ncbi:MAG: hypothetical protein ACLGI8_10235 [Acidimicrobiia bacterium]|jgi:hypothetical protein
METTLTMAGQQAVAGAARLRVGAPGVLGSGARTTCGYAAVPAHLASAGHRTTWTKGAFVIPTTFMVLEHENRPTRLLPERSP